MSLDMNVNNKIKSLQVFEKLKKKRFKLTRPRQAILNVLNMAGDHLSAEKIYKTSSKSYPDIGLASVYRNLELFVDIGVACKFDIGDNKYRYGICNPSGEDHHHHLVCKKCNRVIDYSESLDDEKKFLKRRERNLSRKYDFKIEGHFIDFFGVCKKCNNKK